MSPLYLLNGQLLTRNGLLAANQSCCCSCPVKTTRIRSGFGSNGVATSVFRSWVAGNGPTLSGSIWIWATSTVQNPTQNETFNLVHTFTLPQDAKNLSGYIRIAADNSVNVSLNGVNLGFTRNSHRVVDGVLFAIPNNVLQPGQNVISGPVVNEATAGSTPQTNPGGTIYTLVCTYNSCL